MNYLIFINIRIRTFQRFDTQNVDIKVLHAIFLLSNRSHLTKNKIEFTAILWSTHNSCMTTPASNIKTTNALFVITELNFD